MASDEDDPAKIVADYASGRDVAEIERRYGVTRAEIERLVAETTASSPPSSPRGTAPAPVIAAAAIVGLGALPLLAVGIIMAVADMPLVPVFLIVAIGLAICGSTAGGLWQGRRGARVVTVVVGAMVALRGLTVVPDPVGLLALAGGVAVIVLVTAPSSSRAWFARTRYRR
jgi:uncharacterized small protein (DUF1192 family)